MSDLHSVQWQLQFILRSFVPSGGGTGKPAHDTGSTSYGTSPSATHDFIPYSQPQADAVAVLAFLARVIRSFPPSLSVITLIPVQSSYHTSGTSGCWWLGRHLLTLTVIAITTWHTATKEKTLRHMRSQEGQVNPAQLPGVMTQRVWLWAVVILPFTRWRLLQIGYTASSSKPSWPKECLVLW